MNMQASHAAPYFYRVTFEIAPEDEKEFNEIYGTEHVPNILQDEGVLQVIRLRDAEPTPQWKAKSDLGRWAPVIRPRVKARRQRLGRIAANASRP